jgi:hypothetical protein
MNFLQLKTRTRIRHKLNWDVRMPNNSDPDIFGAETQMKTGLYESEHLLEGECSLLVVTGLNGAQSGGGLQHKAQQT